MQNLIRFFLCMIVGCMVTLSAKAYVLSDHYRTLNIKAEWTKNTTNFDKKNLFPFKFPDNLPSNPVFKGLKGTYSTITQKHINKNGQEVTASETLFSVNYSPSVCPKTAGEIVNSYADFYNNYKPTIGLDTYILKQAVGGREQIGHTNFMYPFGVPLGNVKNGCIIVLFDGSDFTGKNYTMKADLQLKYTFEPMRAGMDGEYIISFANQVTPTLNAYTVIPVTNADVKGVVIKPGTIFNINGDVTTLADDVNTQGNWFVRHITAIYKHNSCQKAFKGHIATKFSWNDQTGTNTKPNPSSVFWPDSIIISDFTEKGTGRAAVSQAVSGHGLPIHVEEGDCLVQASLPYGDNTSNGKSANVEHQVYVNYILD